MENSKPQQKTSSSDVKAWIVLGILAALAIGGVSALQKDWSVSDEDRALIEQEEKAIVRQQEYMLAEALRAFDTDNARFRHENLQSAIKGIKIASDQQREAFKQRLKTKHAQKSGG
jgi:hypothetical protein